MRVWIGVLVVAGAAGACRPKLNSFEVAEACVCKAHAAHLTWSAKGTPTLVATPKPGSNWIDGEVASEGSSAPELAADTTFVIDVPGSSQPKGEKSKTATVRVVDGHRDGAAVNAPTCDATKRIVTGKMQTLASCGVALLTIDHPTVAATDTYAPRQVCLVAPDGQRYCAPPDKATPTIGRVVDDTWSIELALADGESCDDPQQYPSSVKFGFDLDCAHPPKAPAP